MSHVVPVPPLVTVPVKGTDQLFPVRRIYCVGRNYVEHAKEMGYSGREAPFFFLKPSDAIVYAAPGATATIQYPAITKDFHHEIELVVAIGRDGKNIPSATASHHVFGYAVGLDMTRRDLQTEMKRAGRPWCIGKAFDQSAPIGRITAAAQAPNIANAELCVTVNGSDRQRSNTSKMIWNVAEIIEHLSAAWELLPGDLIYTGTPEGVAAVVPGDLMVGEIKGLDPIQVRVI